MPATNPRNRVSQLFPAGLSNVDGLFEQFFGPAPTRTYSARWAAPASVWEEENDLHVQLDAPGVAKEDVEVTYDKGQLTISVARERPAYGDGTDSGRALHDERGYGSVTRTVALPETVDPESLEASLTDGVLHVKVSKTPEAKPRRIELK